MACTDDEKQAAINFAEAFCNLLDKHRDQLAAYLADDAVLDWFGRTISSKDSIAGFMKLEVPETVHNLTSVEPSGPIQYQKMILVEPVDDENSLIPLKGQELFDSLSDEDLAKPLASPDYMVQVTSSGEVDAMSKLSLNSLSSEERCSEKYKSLKCFPSQFTSPMNFENPVASGYYNSAKHEEAQRDCLPKTSLKSFIRANRYLEACGSIQFLKSRQSDMAPKNMKFMSDTRKWCRFCKLQIAYSIPDMGFHSNDCDDGITGDFKIWLLVYRDNTRCRRNLSEAFDQVT